MKMRGSGSGRAMECAIGITVHTGWGACVVVAGSLREPRITSNKVIELLEGAERFCYHRAAEMKAGSVREWLAQVRAKALARARSELASLLDERVAVGAIVARDGNLPDPETALATHMRIHMAEGLFYRDVFRDAFRIPCRITPAASLDITAVGKVATKPWGRDQKLAALAAWQAMSR
ncbi:MAG TPA: hypothetical protein VGR92_05295 [Steroidobacteraceae bacterium]|nr:hypothetical protein [Steroidobacteraceae bacterium]